jgi:hypothetical protein
VRRGERAALRGQRRGQRLKDTRWLLLKPRAQVRGKARQRLEAVIHSKLQTARAWSLKEAFAHFWTYHHPRWAEAFLDAWITRALRSRLGRTSSGPHTSTRRSARFTSSAAARTCRCRSRGRRRGSATTCGSGGRGCASRASPCGSARSAATSAWRSVGRTILSCPPALPAFPLPIPRSPIPAGRSLPRAGGNARPSLGRAERSRRGGAPGRWGPSALDQSPIADPPFVGYRDGRTAEPGLAATPTLIRPRQAALFRRGVSAFNLFSGCGGPGTDSRTEWNLARSWLS